MSEYACPIKSLKDHFDMENYKWEMRSAWLEKTFGPFTPLTEEEMAEALKPYEKHQEYRHDLIEWKTEEEKLAFKEKWKEYEDEIEEYYSNGSVVRWHEQFKQKGQVNE